MFDLYWLLNELKPVALEMRVFTVWASVFVLNKVKLDIKRLLNKFKSNPPSYPFVISGCRLLDTKCITYSISWQAAIRETACRTAIGWQQVISTKIVSVTQVHLTYFRPTSA